MTKLFYHLFGLIVCIYSTTYVYVRRSLCEVSTVLSKLNKCNIEKKTHAF